jgi:geranylgeranyl transferase type-2 subunit beta
MIIAGKLQSFILACQDAEDGGISDRPANVADVFHTFFGISGLSLLRYFDGKSDFSRYRRIDPVYALPADLVQEMGLQSQVLPQPPQE